MDKNIRHNNTPHHTTPPHNQTMTHNEHIIIYLNENTKHFDASHNAEHAITVYNTACKIMDSFACTYDKDVLAFAALLHDVCDHKYKHSQTPKQLREFINKYIDDTRTDFVMKLINNISYSKEASGKRESFTDAEKPYLDAISDADRLEAIGTTGILRCQTFVEAHGGKVPDDVVAHCHDKLLKLYPLMYIKTDYARKLAEPLHQEIVRYVAGFESTFDT